MTVWQQGVLGVVWSHSILDELVQVLSRLKKVHMTAMEIRDLADSLMFQAEMVEPDGAADLALRATLPTKQYCKLC